MGESHKGKDTDKNRYIARWSRVKKAIDLLGGKCSRCGEAHIATLSFHHLDPSQKQNEISSLLTRSDWSAIEVEIKKCILLCENCHRKEHFDEVTYRERYDEICQQASGVRYQHQIVIKRWSDQETQEMLGLYNSGMKIPEIASSMQRMPGTINQRIRRAIKEKLISPRKETAIPNKKRKKLTEEMKSKIVEMDKQHFTNVEINAALDVSISVIARVKRDARLCGQSDGA
jgi:transposase-like protein